MPEKDADMWAEIERLRAVEASYKRLCSRLAEYDKACEAYERAEKAYWASLRKQGEAEKRKTEVRESLFDEVHLGDVADSAPLLKTKVRKEVA